MKTEKIYWFEKSFIGLQPEDQCSTYRMHKYWYYYYSVILIGEILTDLVQYNLALKYIVPGLQHLNYCTRKTAIK
jgi:uncharacterized membrane protein YcgQ (UPF0703/DUF1980 family)